MCGLLLGMLWLVVLCFGGFCWVGSCWAGGE